MPSRNTKSEKSTDSVDDSVKTTPKAGVAKAMSKAQPTKGMTTPKKTSPSPTKPASKSTTALKANASAPLDAVAKPAHPKKTSSINVTKTTKVVPTPAFTPKTAQVVVATAPVSVPGTSSMKPVPIVTTTAHAPTASETADVSIRIDATTGARIKTLPPSVVKDIEQKNLARRQAGLEVIHVRVRQCLTCSTLFESAGNRTCGCASRAAGHMAGREII